jgi:hypothetical protein
MRHLRSFSFFFILLLILHVHPQGLEREVRMRPVFVDMKDFPRMATLIYGKTVFLNSMLN